MIYKKDNVEKVVEDKVAAARLEKLGFVRIDGSAETKKTEPASKKELDDMTIQELRKLAKAQGVKGAAALSKEDLLEILK